MATKNIETISGTVEQVNAKQTGIKVRRVAEHQPVPPDRADTDAGRAGPGPVERTDKGAWINSLQIIGAAEATSSPGTRDRTITRMACLKAAATFAAGKCLGGSAEVKSGDVLRIAESWVRWVEEED